jgi:hypothetical protein
MSDAASGTSPKRQKTDAGKKKDDTIEFDKKLSCWFSMSSDGKFGRSEKCREDYDNDSEYEQDEGEEAHKLEGKTLGEIFSLNHVNLITVVQTLMMERDMTLYVQKVFMDDKYLKTGEADYSAFELCTCRATKITYFNEIEQPLLAGLQILYSFSQNGKLNGNNKAKDASASRTHSKKDKHTNIDLSFKFNGQDVRMAVREAMNESYISLYVHD